LPGVRLTGKLAALGAALVLAATPAVPAAADTAPAAMFGSDDVGFVDGSDEAGRVARVADMVDYVSPKKPILRLDIFWDTVQACAACGFDWTRLDPVVDAAAAQGVRVLLILDYAAPWANGNQNPRFFPTDDAAWAAFVTAAVSHFTPKVQAYEVWNEPNNAGFGSYGDNSLAVRAGRYWQLVKIAYGRVHAGCPACVVLAGGSGGGDSYTDAAGHVQNDNEGRDWLEWAYQHGYGSSFDAVATHPYPDWGGGHLPSYAKLSCTDYTWYRYWSGFGPDDPTCGELAAIRAVMVQYGDAAKKIWATEFGFPTSGSRLPQSAEHVRDALEEGVRLWRSRPYTGPLFVYAFQDTQKSLPLCANPNEGECHFGLRDADGNPKEPIYSDVRAALRGDEWLPSLSPGRSMFRGTALKAYGGRFWLWLQGDGNLVLYDTGNGTSKVLWKRDTLRAYRLTNQHDGNLALYDQADTLLWSTGTGGKGDSTLWMQEDGNLVLYAHLPAPAKATWASNTVSA
jgi:hypothetical protein